MMSNLGSTAREGLDGRLDMAGRIEGLLNISEVAATELGIRHAGLAAHFR